jgi:DNA-binding FrmR family transcriptional regulator
MRRHDEMRLETAVKALQTDAPDATQLAAAARRVAGRLGIDAADQTVIDIIENCDDVQQLLASYRAGTLSGARRLLIEGHLRDCGVCLRSFRSGSEAAVLNWSVPAAKDAFVWPSQALGLAMAACFTLLVCSFFVYKAYWQIPPGVRAEVQSIDGSADGISDAGDRQLSAGDQLKPGEQLRTSGGSHAVLRLSDGSHVEVKERSVLGFGARGHNMTISLDSGAVIVEAAKREQGHLYLKTPDCRVAVTGTVFSVNSGIKGSRVAVLQGSVQVMHSGMDTLVHAGDQIATNDNLSPEPVEQQISWSQDRDKYLLLLAQFTAIQHRLEQVPFPQPRYSSDLLERVPADTLLYISIPNLGEFLSQANQIFQDQLKQSPALQQWWGRGQGNTADLDSLIEKLHQASRYLGNEIVIVGTGQTATPGFAILTDLQQSGLDAFLRTQFASSPGLVLLDEKSLQNTPASSQTKSGGYALIRQREAVFSNNIATLKEINAQLNAGASGFAAGEFGQQIAAAYGRGAGVILAADLHQMVADKLSSLHARGKGTDATENSGMEDVRYLIAEHRETNGLPANHLDLQFSGTRQRAASWLAAPAPIGTLDFVTPNAAIAVAFLSKDPTMIADDLMSMAVKDHENTKWTEAEAKLRISFRDDLAANLGGDFLLSLDGPVLPTPSWKAVIEVQNPQALESTLERLTQSLRDEAQGTQSHPVAIESSQVGAQRFYSVRDLTSGTTVAQYIFADGYMIVSPNRALLLDALQTHASGDSLARSTAFKALLPKDENENYSAIAYQNLGPVLSPLLSQLSAESAEAIRQIAADARPTALCAWGKDSRIEAASNSHLFGFDFLTLGALTTSGNKHPSLSVKE